MSELATCVEHLVDGVLRTLAERRQRPRATYRLQFRPDDVTFRAAAALVPYLADLGISHLYASPYRKARSGNPHGYAIVDYDNLNPELGTPEDHRAMVDALHAHGLGHILDIVPNHMSIEPGENQWWTDVLENGPGSPFSPCFDIDWQPVKEELANKVLLPMLGDQYGEVLESGHLRVDYQQREFRLRVYEKTLPLDPKTFTQLLTHRLDELRQRLPQDSPDLRELESIVTALEHLPDRNETQPDRVAERRREKEVVKERLARLTATSADMAAFVERNVLEFNGTPGDPASFDRLERLLDAQVYRLADWRTAADEINYRRFFDINELAAVCMESEPVFDASHRLVFDLLVRGDLEGLRIDHVDGLLNPTEFLWRLQWGYVRTLGRAIYERFLSAGADADVARGTTGSRNGDNSWAVIEAVFLRALWRRIGGLDPARVFPSLTFPPLLEPTEAGYAQLQTAAEAKAPRELPLHIVVEKILDPVEPLPAEWPVAGTTGYDFLNQLGGLFVSRPGLKQLRSNYRRFVGQRLEFEEAAYQGKVTILRVAMSSELQMLAHRLNRISERHRRFRDLTFNTLRVALREILAHFPIYRTYIGQGTIAERDRRFVQWAVALAKRSNPVRSAVAFDFIRGVLLLEQPPELDEAGRRERELFVGRFQQVTSPVMAKGVEDTAFYRCFPLTSLNEVGADPAKPPAALECFHRENVFRRTQYPFSLLATSTHDTKRSEDVRARISVLSEIPQAWRAAVNRWSRMNRRHRTDLDAVPAPSRNDEYLFYQTLVGLWPLTPPDANVRRDLTQRLQCYMEKATREAKLHTSWINPDPGYDGAVRQFVAAVLEDHPKNRFLPDFQAFHEQVVDWGLYTALAQAALKLASPGVPDIYQGQELWDFSLVDPDNRRPVDFARPRNALAQLQHRVAEGSQARLLLARELAQTPRDPRLKLYVTWQMLQFRRRYGEFFDAAEYVPVTVDGPQKEHVCSFVWRMAPADGQPGRFALVVVPRLIAQLLQTAGVESTSGGPVGGSVWQSTRLVLDELGISGGTELLTGRPLAWTGGQLAVAELLSEFPAALLTDLL